MNIKIHKYLVPFLCCTAVLCCLVSDTEGNNISSAGFYGTPDEIIRKFNNDNPGYRGHFLMGLAYKSKNEYKNAIFHFANSCFRYSNNRDIKLYPDPVYRFVNGFHVKSEYYDDSVFEIARLFLEYQENEYAVKFLCLMGDSSRALYREGILLKAKTLITLDRPDEAGSALKDLLGRFDDPGSRSDIHIRIASVHEKKNDIDGAVREYLKIINIDDASWQSGTAARRIVQLSGKYSYKFSEKEILKLVSALYNSSQYNEAADLMKTLPAKSADQEVTREASRFLIRLYIRKKREKDAEKLLASFKLDAANLPGLRMAMADELWSVKKREKAVRIYRELLEDLKEPYAGDALKKIAGYMQREEKPGFEKYMEAFIKKYPGDKNSELYMWILSREAIRKKEFSAGLNYLESSLAAFPDGLYSGHARFWLWKLYTRLSKTAEAEKNLIALAQRNADSSYAWSALMKVKDNYNIDDLYRLFEESLKTKDAGRAALYNALIIIKDRDFEKRNDRIKKMISLSLAPDFNELEKEITDPEFSSESEDILKGIEKYFAVGYTEAINRELALVPDKPALQRERFKAFAYYGKIYGSYYHALIGTLKLLSQRPLIENFHLLPENIIKILYPDAFREDVEKWCGELGLDRLLVYSVVKTESSFNHQAVSPAGAAGLMQIMPSTGRGIAKNLKIKEFDLKDPRTSIYFGMNYLVWLKKVFNDDFDGIIAGYNAGPSNMKKWKKKFASDDSDLFLELIPYDETRYYILRVRKFYYIYDILFGNPGFYR